MSRRSVTQDVVCTPAEALGRNEADIPAIGKIMLENKQMVSVIGVAMVVTDKSRTNVAEAVRNLPEKYVEVNDGNR